MLVPLVLDSFSVSFDEGLGLFVVGFVIRIGEGLGERERWCRSWDVCDMR